MIIAEAGLNHLGDLNLLNSYFEHIRNSEVDAVTVQVARESFFDDVKCKKYKLGDENLIDFLKKVKSVGKKIGVAIDGAFNVDDIDKIGQYEALKVDFYKVLSSDMLNVDLIRELFCSTAESIYVSTGMNTYQEIDDLAEAVTRKGEHNIDRLCMACLDGQYITGDVDAKKMDSLEKKRNMERSYLQ